MKYKLIIFDFDGTLADTFPFVLRVMDQVTDKYNLRRVDRSEIDLLRGYDARKIIKHLGIPLWKIPSIGKHARSLLKEEIHLLTLFEGIEQLLEDLANEGVKLAIVTSNTNENVRKILGPKNAELIQYYECGVHLYGKQAKLKKVLRQSGVEPEEAICIGDEIRDIQAAQKAKIPFGAVTWGFTTMDALKAYSPMEIFTSVAEMAEKIA